MSKNIAELDKHADEIRKDLAVPKQTEVFAAATEAGYLAATSDGTLDDEERSTLLDHLPRRSEHDHEIVLAARQRLDRDPIEEL